VVEGNIRNGENSRKSKRKKKNRRELLIAPRSRRKNEWRLSDRAERRDLKRELVNIYCRSERGR